MSLIPESRDTPRRHEWFTLRPFAVIAASVACVWSTSLIVKGWQASHAPLTEHTIVSSGTAKRHLTPDAITWDATVTGHATDRAGAARQLGTALERTRGFLLDHELQGGELTVYPATVDQDTLTLNHTHSDGTMETSEVPNGFIATQLIRIHPADVGRGLRAFHAAAATVDTAITLVEPTCTVRTLDVTHDELLALANRDVRAHGEAAVQAIGGAQLGKLVASDGGAFSVDGLGTASLVTCERGADVLVTATATYALE